ncbi:C-GCAxxG-C-C family protein [Desulfospira joergensenii]|uniref:C-GCAxxG-C-C family protein n=1 Tax=Desulfospira joergensenii TaxID=53329 RepID=UPI0003B788C6|nr:C-GCAxxG-C-C family protein [Desulfospira joergensenii]
MKKSSVVAVDMFLKGYNCAQSVLYAFSEELGLSKETALKISCGFGAGMGRRQKTCGALTGGILVLGMRHGRGVNDGKEAMETTYAKTQELMDQFKAKHGSCICRDLLKGCDLTTEEGQGIFRENDYLTKICKTCVQSVVEILGQI